jgi:hypothetical protein
MPELTAIIKSVGNWFKLARPLQCSGCGRVRDNKSIVSAPSVSLCRECWYEAFDAMKGQKQGIVVVCGTSTTFKRCSFCGHSVAETGGLATWLDVAICGDCMLVCDEIFDERGV